LSRQVTSKSWLYLIPLVLFAGDPLTAAEVSANIESVTELLNQELVIAPEDDAKRFDLARILASRGQYAQALAHYELLVREHPENVDYSFGRAQVLAWMGSDAKALTELERAKRLAPDYEDVWELNFAIANRQLLNDVDIEALRAEAKTRFPNSTWWQNLDTDQEFEWQLTVGGAYENLSGGLPAWKSQFAEVSWQRNSASLYFSRLTRDERFYQTDTQFAVGSEWHSPGAWFAGLALAASNNPSFQPVNDATAHIGRSLPNGWGMDVRWRQKRYDTATVSTYTALAEKYFGKYRAAYSLNASRLHGEQTSLAHLLALNWYVTDLTSFGLVMAVGEEAEVIVPGQILQTDVRSATLSGRHKLNRRMTFNWWVGTHKQGTFYRRSYAGLAVSIGL
jgi:YaiO family outer membrane protein